MIMLALSLLHWALWLALHLSWWLVQLAAGYLFFVLLTLAWRYLRLKCARRLQPRESRAILITGATSGIGLAATKHFHRLGFTLLAAYYNDQELGFQELSELASREGRLHLVRMDVSSAASVQKASEEIEEILDKSRLELVRLVNNAGTGRAGPFEWTSEESINCTLDTNLRGAMLVTRRLVCRIVQSRGRVVNVSSALSHLPLPGVSVYGATKSALCHFSQALHLDLAPYGASCCSILPGNLIANSNILYTRVACLQQSLRELSERELATYARSIKVYSRILYQMLRLKLRKSGADPHEMARLYRFELPPELANDPSLTSGPKEGLAGGLTRPKRPSVLMDQLDGRVQSLEDASLMGAFEDALLVEGGALQERTYAGNALFVHLVGPLMEHLTPALFALASRLALVQVAKPRAATRKIQ